MQARGEMDVIADLALPVRSYAFPVQELRRHLRQILGLDRRLRVAIVGAGNLGLALADYPGFREDGFEIVALFDTLKEKIGRRSRGGVLIHRSFPDTGK